MTDPHGKDDPVTTAHPHAEHWRTIRDRFPAPGPPELAAPSRLTLEQEHAAQVAAELRDERVKWYVVCVLQGWYSAACMVVGYSYIPALAGPSTLPKGLDILTAEGAIPIWVYGSAWALGGALGVISAVFKLRRLFWTAYIWLAILAAIWTVGYLVGWIQSPPGDRGYLNVASYMRTLAPQLALMIFIPQALKYLDRRTEEHATMHGRSPGE